MRRLAPFLSILFGLGLFATPSAAQRAVRGTVKTDSGIAMPAATIVLRLPESGLQRYGTATDADGTFALTDVAPARYELTASFVGFRSAVRMVDVRSADANDLEIELSEGTLQYGEVLVSTRRLRLQLEPVTFSNLTSRELERLPEMKDLPVHLARQPSVTYHSENGNGIGYSTLRMRGFGQRRLAIAINGIPQNDPEEFNVFWINFFDIQGSVEDIQIQRGAGSSVYGPAAIGGAVNIRAMPYRSRPYARAEVGVGTYDTQRYSLEVNSGLMGGNTILFGRISRLLSDGYRRHSWARFWRFFAGITRYGQRSSVTLQAYGGPQEDALAYSGIPKAANRHTVVDEFGTKIDRRYNFSAFDGDIEHFHQPHVELHHELALSDAADFKQALFWVQGKGYFDFGGTFRSADYLRLPEGFVPDEDRALPLYLSRPDISLLFRAYLDQWQVGWLPQVSIRKGPNTFRFGAELRLHRSLRWGRIQGATGIPEDLVGSENDARVYSFRGEKVIGALYASSLLRPSEWWAVQTDVQMTHRAYRVYDEAFFGHDFRIPYTFVNPRVGVTWAPEKDVSAYTSVALAHREPRLKSLYDGEEAGAGFEPAFEMRPDGSYDTDAPLVTPERLLDLEAGIRIRRPGYRATVNFFLMNFWDEIVPSGGLDQYGVPRSGNADETRHLGVEVDGSIRPMTGVDLSGNVTISRNRFVRFEEFLTLPDFSTVQVRQDGHPIAGFPDVSGNLDVTYTAGALIANLHGTYVGKQYIDNNEGRDETGMRSEDRVNDAFFLVDGSIRYTFAGDSPLAGFRISLDINNVFDRRVLAYGNVGATGPQFFPAATRHVFVGAVYTMR